MTANYYRIEDMTWPSQVEAARIGHDLHFSNTPEESLETHRLFLLSVLTAYQQLITCSKRKRDRIISQMREMAALEAAEAEKGH